MTAAPAPGRGERPDVASLGPRRAGWGRASRCGPHQGPTGPGASTAAPDSPVRPLRHPVPVGARQPSASPGGSPPRWAQPQKGTTAGARVPPHLAKPRHGGPLPRARDPGRTHGRSATSGPPPCGPAGPAEGRASRHGFPVTPSGREASTAAPSRKTKGPRRPPGPIDHPGRDQEADGLICPQLGPAQRQRGSGGPRGPARTYLGSRKRPSV